MSGYSTITIIYNPNSTGQSQQLAKAMKNLLQKNLSGQKVSLQPTRHPGHAETLAYDIAKATPRPLIVSASGDGGYHEVINGVQQAQEEGANPVVGLLPAGNANDHFNSLHTADFIKNVSHGKERTIDLLRLSCIRNGQPFERYAHSYIGIGLTPQVGRELNKTQLNRLKEMWIVLKGLLFIRPVSILVDGKLQTYDSLIFSNIEKMSKVLSLSDKAKVDDGKFEVAAHKRGPKLKFLTALLKASTVGHASDFQRSSFSFQTIKPTLIQLDGEVTKIDAHCKVTISLKHTALRCIV